MKLPNIIANSNEEYVTIPPLKNFVKENGISVSANTKDKYIEAISKFADQSDESKEIVFSWIDKVVKEGIKEVQILNIPISGELEIIFSSKENAAAYLKKFIPVPIHHLSGNSYGNDYTLVKVDVDSDDHGNYVSLLFCRMLRYHDVKTGRGAILEYPVFVDYYYDSGWLIIRYKSRSALFDIMPDGTPLEEWLKHTLSVNKEIDKVLKRSKDILRLSHFEARVASVRMRTKFFNLLDKYTHTPKEIADILEKNKNGIEKISEQFVEMFGIPQQLISKTTIDIKNMAEKYLSITWQDKSIFTNDRDAFPTRLSTTDEEESKVDQTAASPDEPLQSKEVFFDNKRMLYNQKSCDSLTLMWQRMDRTYYEKFFPVRFSEKSGICTLSFKKFVAEEDMKRVLFAIIDS